MARTPSTMKPLGTPAPEFALPDTAGRIVMLSDFEKAPALLVAFICNHCPYVKAVVDRIVRDTKALREFGVGAVAISSNDAATYPEDSFQNMTAFARRHGFDFAYLYDESQDVARAYGAACTPEFFGFDRDRVLQYHGRLDASRHRPAAAGAKRELVEAMKLVVETGRAPGEQTASIGCSIKWAHR